MTDIQTLRSDIDYVKTLADEGRNGPISGFFGFGLGMIWTLAALAMWLELSGRVSFPAPFHYTEFFVAFLAQLVFMAIVFPALRRSGPTSRTARQFGLVWGGMGLTSGILMLGVGLTSWRLGGGIEWRFLGPIFIALYGGAWVVNGWMAERLWMQVVGYGSIPAVVLLALTAQSPADQMLAYSACLFLLGAAPGLYMMRLNAKAR